MRSPLDYAADTFIKIKCCHRVLLYIYIYITFSFIDTSRFHRIEVITDEGSAIAYCRDSNINNIFLITNAYVINQYGKSILDYVIINNHRYIYIYMINCGLPQ